MLNQVQRHKCNISDQPSAFPYYNRIPTIYEKVFTMRKRPFVLITVASCAILLVTLQSCATPSRAAAAPVVPHIVPEMVRVEAGTFQMGDEVGDLWPGTRPVHEVALTYDFLIGKYLITFDQYDNYSEATGAESPGRLCTSRGGTWFAIATG